MESNRLTQQRGQRRTMRVSGRLCNDDDELIWPIGGRFTALFQRLYACLVVARTTAGTTPASKPGKPFKWPHTG